MGRSINYIPCDVNLSIDCQFLAKIWMQHRVQWRQIIIAYTIYNFATLFVHSNKTHQVKIGIIIRENAFSLSVDWLLDQNLSNRSQTRVLVRTELQRFVHNFISFTMHGASEWRESSGANVNNCFFSTISNLILHVVNALSSHLRWELQEIELWTAFSILLLSYCLLCEQRTVETTKKERRNGHKIDFTFYSVVLFYLKTKYCG